MEAFALPLVDPVDAELPGLEGAVTGGDDDRARKVGAARLRRQREVLLPVLIDELESLRLLAEDDLRAVLEALLGAHLDELLPEDLRMPGDVEHVLLGIGRGHLTPELLEALDDPNRRIAVPCVIRSREPDGARAQDRDVDEAVSAHGRNLVQTQCPQPGPQPPATSSGTVPSSTWNEWPQPQEEVTFGLLIAKPPWRPSTKSISVPWM